MSRICSELTRCSFTGIYRRRPYCVMVPDVTFNEIVWVILFFFFQGREHTHNIALIFLSPAAKTEKFSLFSPEKIIISPEEQSFQTFLCLNSWELRHGITQTLRSTHHCTTTCISLQVNSNNRFGENAFFFFLPGVEFYISHGLNYRVKCCSVIQNKWKILPSPTTLTRSKWLPQA